MNNTIFKAPSCHIKSFDNLFIEMTAKNCNQRCKNCYINFPLNKNVKDFIPIENIKNALLTLKSQNIKCIYLIGAEPMSHPNFNAILRMCLKYSNVCIHTNGTYINEKKSRFLKRVQDESNNEIIFKLSIDHYNELKNDEVRTRGSYRVTLNAVKCLAKQQFNPILTVTNFYKEPNETLIKEITQICLKQGYNIPQNNIHIVNHYFDKNNSDTTITQNWESLDCEYGRVLTAKGIYSCPFLSNDYRGRCGSDFNDFSEQNTLESEFCSICTKNGENIFGINFNLYED